MRNPFLIYGLAGLAVLASCRRVNPTYREAKDADLSIQVMRLDQTKEEASQWSYQAKLIPDKKLLEMKGQQARNALYYQMDSCFYVSDGKSKIYAALVQPVANGTSGSFEYLLEFEKGQSGDKDPGTIMYQDKYINGKTYALKSTGE